MGTPSLYRRRDGVQLTAAGSVLVEESRAVLSLLEHGVSRSRRAAGLSSGSCCRRICRNDSR
jgi:DNA-binding transcriptional LysR family regulator